MAQEHYSPSGRGPELIAVFAFFSALTTITFALRVFVRTRIVRAFGLDDWTAAVGWLLFVIHSAFAIIGAHHGTGQHANLIQPPTELPIALMWWWLCEPLYVVSNMAVKLSIALMLLRLVVERSHRVLIYVVTTVIQIYSLVFFFLFIFQCTPSSFFWTRFQGATNGQCMDPNITVLATYVYSGITVVCDWTMALLPWFVVRKLQMNSRTKIMVAIVLAMGSIASIATIVRIPYIHNLSNTADFLYSTTDVAIWSCCETGLSITASCAATLKPLFRTFLSRSRLFHSDTVRSSHSLPFAAGPLPGGMYAKGSYIRTSDRSRENSEQGDQINGESRESDIEMDDHGRKEWSLRRSRKSLPSVENK